MKNHIFWSLCLCLILVAACAPDSQQNQAIEDSETELSATIQSRAIAPPMDNVRVPATNMTVEVDEDFFQELDNGTSIHIPANSLVNAEGESVVGEVDLSYREFHDVADVLLSGISMLYDSAGETHILQTAGMLEIRASKDGEPVFIADGQRIHVEMASFKTGAYSLYRMNEEVNNWSYIRTAAPEANSRKIANISAGTLGVPALPLKPKKISDDEVVFIIDANFKKYPELAPYKDLDWQWAGIEEEGTQNPNKEKWIFGETWKRARITPKNSEKGLYYLQLSNNKKRARMIVRPAVSEENYAAAIAIYEDIKRKRKAIMAQLKVEEARLAQQADFLRTLNVSNFGIYNWDIIMKDEQRQIMANFEFDANQLTDFTQISQVFLVMLDRNTVVKYPIYEDKPEAKQMFIFSEKANNKLIAILPDNKIAVFDEKDFAEQEITDDFTFNMRTLEQSISSPSDLKKVLGLPATPSI